MSSLPLDLPTASRACSQMAQGPQVGGAPAFQCNVSQNVHWSLPAFSSRAWLFSTRVQPADVARSSRKPSEAVSLCGPIMDRSGRQAKPTAVTHQQGLTDALAQYTDGQVSSAVAAFCAEPWDSIDHPLAVFIRRAQIGHAMFTDDPPAVDLRETPVGERPTLVTDATHLLDADGFDRAGQGLGQSELAKIRAGLRSQRIGL